MQENKDHWYDGWFYDTFIAPNQDKLFSEIKDLIEPNSKILDVGCGTGRFSFFISDKCDSVLGIDLSKCNIEKANKNLAQQPNLKISFLHTNLFDLITKKIHFDYAVMTYVIHEVDENERATLLADLSKISDKIIIGDYSIPTKKGFWNLLNEMVEFAAGKEHYYNFKNYVRNGGIREIASQARLKVISEIIDRPLTGHLVVLSNK